MSMYDYRKKYDYNKFLRLVQQIHEERKQNNIYKTLSDENSLDEMDFDNVTSFDDLMLDYAKSKDEILLQRVNEFIDIVYEKAEQCYCSGKRDLVIKVKKDGYSVVDNKKVVIDYMIHSSVITNSIEDDLLRRMEEDMLTFHSVINNDAFREIVVEPINNEVFEVFMYWMTRLAEKDNISVAYRVARLHFSDHINDSCTYTLPCRFDDDKKGWSYYDAFRFEYTLPERYSEERMEQRDRELELQKEQKKIDELMYESNIDELLNSVDNMEGHMFEQYCANLLSENGYIDVEVTSGSRDQGIDIIAYKDRIKFGIQCKCYSSLVGNAAVQEANAGKMFYNCNVGVVLTNQFFTVSAEELAESTGIVLWDRSELENLIVQANKKSLN